MISIHVRNISWINVSRPDKQANVPFKVSQTTVRRRQILTRFNLCSSRVTFSLNWWKSPTSMFLKHSYASSVCDVKSFSGVISSWSVVYVSWCVDSSLSLPYLLLQLLIPYISKNASWHLFQKTDADFFPMKQSWIMCQAVCPLLRVHRVLLFRYSTSDEDSTILDIFHLFN